MSAARHRRVQSLDRALDLLETLANEDELGVSELAHRTGLVPSTAHRLLATLGDRRYVTQNDRGRYLLGPRLLELTHGRENVVTRAREIARPHLQLIQRATGETTNLVVLEGADVVYVDQVEGSRTMRMFTEVGSTARAHSTGAGKAILAWLPIDELALRFNSGDRNGEPALDRLTPRTLTTLQDLQEDLARVRRRGFATDNEEHEEGVSCVAAPIFDGDGVPCAAISVSGPSPRILTADTTDIGTLVRDHATQVSSALGHRPSG